MSKKNIYLLYGPPASGKSTIAHELSKSKGLEYVSVGKITRAEMLRKSDKGIQLKKCIDEDVEYPPELISEVVQDYTSDLYASNNSFLFDGFPKYPAETIPFLKMLHAQKAVVPAIFIIDIPLNVALQRVANRRICQKCLTQFSFVKNKLTHCSVCNGELIIRDDDIPEMLEKRYQDFNISISKTLNILEATKAKMFRIDGILSKGKVLSDILSKID